MHTMQLNILHTQLLQLLMHVLLEIACFVAQLLGDLHLTALDNDPNLDVHSEA